MTTETGNAQSEVADPSQPYGLSRWLASQPLFSETKTPTVKYERRVNGGLNIQPNAGDPYPWLGALPERGDGGDDPQMSSPSQPGTVGGEALGGILGDFLGSNTKNGRQTTNYAGLMGSAGRAAQGALNLSPITGVITSGIGRLVDQTKANQDLYKMGAGQLGLGDYLSSVLNGVTFGIAGKSINDAYAGKLGDWVKTAEEQMSMNGILDRLNADSYGDYAGGKYSDYISAEDPSIGWGWPNQNPSMNSLLDEILSSGSSQAGGQPESSYVDSLGRSWSGPDGSGMGATGGDSANDTGGGWSGGSDDRDIESGGEW